ncbi:MAG: beta-ketoacyl-[acyl-carrier-protein] synthase family protein, partial [Myxococcota bacterium]|nr:beta-ketoacyl-[acyl-carrier-protein] synthase family protein [Myxococcota bacterium]
MIPRVFVTGVGVVSSIGFGRRAFFQALEAGTSGISPVTAFDSSRMGRHFAGEVKGFIPRDHLTRSELHRVGRCSAMAIAAARMAVADACLDQTLVPARTAVVLGTTMGEADILGALERAWIVHGVEAVSRPGITKYGSTLLPIHVAG